MNDTLILGIETTCDETAAAVVKNGREVLSNVVSSQIDLHRKFGGVVPEIASRAHLETHNGLVDEALATAGISDPAKQLAGVAVAQTPGLIGCLLVGVNTAKGLAFAWQKPLIAVNHVHAHLYSVLLDSPVQTDFPAIGLVISGGHSSLYLVRSFTDITPIGHTLDDAVGEAFDKVAAILQLGYPGGPLIDKLATHGNANAIDFPVAYLQKDSLNFSFSGLKTSVLYHVNGKQGRERDASALSEQQKADVAASFQRAAATTLISRLKRAVEMHDARAILVGGGVSANSVIRASLNDLARKLKLPILIPPMTYCTDNAAMIAGLGHELLTNGRTAELSVDAVATS